MTVSPETTTVQPDFEIALRFLQLVQPAAHAPICIFVGLTSRVHDHGDCTYPRLGGFYNHREALQNQLIDIQSQYSADCIKVTVNTLTASVLDRFNNAYREMEFTDPLLDPADATRLNWMPIRIGLDPDQPDPDLANQVHRRLTEAGLRDPLWIDSYDSTTLLYPVRLEPGDADITEQINQALNNQFDAASDVISLGLSYPGQLVPLPGMIQHRPVCEDRLGNEWHFQPAGLVQWRNADGPTPMISDADRLMKALEQLEPKMHALQKVRQIHKFQMSRIKQNADQQLEPEPAGASAPPDIQLQSEHLYVANRGGMYATTPTTKGLKQERLTNFTARVVSDITTVQGNREQPPRRFGIEAVLEHTDSPIRIEVDAKDFEQLKWVNPLLGPTARILPGTRHREHVLNAIQSLSTDIEVRSVYPHIGWIQLDGQPVFLHAGGGLGARGPVEHAYCQPPSSLRNFRLNLPGDAQEQKANCSRVLEIADLVEPSISVPVLGHLLRSVLGENQMGVMLVSDTGALKTSFAAVAQSFFGTDFAERSLPANFEDSTHALRNTAHWAKDVLLAVDEFKTKGGGERDRELEEKMDALVRGTANGAGRARMNRNQELVPEDEPRAAPLMTGEKMPDGNSLRARTWFCVFEPGQIDPKGLGSLQEQAAKGTYCRFMGGYIQWLADRYDTMVRPIEQRLIEARPEQSLGKHLRINALYTNLRVGWSTFLNYCVAIGALSDAQARTRLQAVDQLLQEQARYQACDLEDDTPAKRMLSLLGQALANAKAVVKTTQGRQPRHANLLGWNHPGVNGTSRAKYSSEPIGWVDESEPEQLLYLLPDVALRVAQTMSGQNEEIRSFDHKQMGKQLRSSGLLALCDNSRSTPTLRKQIGGSQQKVWAIRLSDVVEIDPQAMDQPRHGLRIAPAV